MENSYFLHGFELGFHRISHLWNNLLRGILSHLYHSVSNAWRFAHTLFQSTYKSCKIAKRQLQVSAKDMAKQNRSNFPKKSKRRYNCDHIV